MSDGAQGCVKCKGSNFSIVIFHLSSFVIFHFPFFACDLSRLIGPDMSRFVTSNSDFVTNVCLMDPLSLHCYLPHTMSLAARVVRVVGEGI